MNENKKGKLLIKGVSLQTVGKLAFGNPFPFR